MYCFAARHGQGYRLKPHVILGVIADLEPVLVQFRNLLPCHVVVLVRCKGKTLCNEEGRVEPKPSNMGRTVV